VFPPALRGIMLAAFAAAYMSTIGTQLNWGASYVVNDFYRRFARRGAQEREYVVVSQLVTVALMLVSIYVTLHLASIEQAWKLLIVTGAGTGTVLLLRWFWWRINAWSEVSAMAVAAVVSLYLQNGLKWPISVVGVAFQRADERAAWLRAGLCGAVRGGSAAAAQRGNRNCAAGRFCDRRVRDRAESHGPGVRCTLGQRRTFDVLTLRNGRAAWAVGLA